MLQLWRQSVLKKQSKLLTYQQSKTDTPWRQSALGEQSNYWPVTSLLLRLGTFFIKSENTKRSKLHLYKISGKTILPWSKSTLSSALVLTASVSSSTIACLHQTKFNALI